MANVFDYRDSSRGVFVNLDFMLVEDTGYLAANNLFYGSGGVSGTYTWFDESLNRFVTSETGMGQSGVIGFGPPIDVLHRDMPGIDLPAAFDESQDFTGLVGGQTAENEGSLSAYFRLFGVAMPTLTWDNTAFGMTDAAAAAEFQANLEAAAADYLAQLQAVLAASVRNGIDMVNWLQGGTAAQPGFVLHFTPDADTGLTYGDFLEVSQDAFGRTHLFARSPVGDGPLFGPDETVDIILTGRNDTVSGSAGADSGSYFAAGTVNLDTGAGHDQVRLFNTSAGPGALPQLMTIDAGRGADTIEIGAWFDLLVSAGTGDDRIDLSYAETDSQASHTLRGGAGDDVIVGSAQGRHVMAGGGGTDYLYGGDNVDVLTGGAGLDTLFGHGGNDSLRGDAGADWLIGGDGHDTVLGGAGNDTLQGEAGNDLIRGDSGNDEIHGEAGRDTMDGGAGNDRISGGGGQDCFRFGDGSGRDTVEDYQRGEAIQIDAGLWDGSVADFVAANVFVSRAGILTIRLTEMDRVQLLGSQALVPEDFLDAISFI